MKTLFQQHPDSISKYVFLEKQEDIPSTWDEGIEEIEPESIFEVMNEFQQDADPDKINASIGVVLNENGGPLVFPSVQKAFRNINVTNFNYQSPRGNPQFLDSMTKLYLGEDIDLEKVALQATAGGTQANRIFADLLAKQNKKINIQRTIFLSDLDWAPHEEIFEPAGKIQKISHLTEDGFFNFEAYKKSVEQASPRDVLVIQGGGAHNPTGQNFSIKQLKEVIEIANNKGVILFVDFPYLGYGDGFEEDAKFAQLAFEKADDIGIATSASKTFSMYSLRAGTLMIKVENADKKRLLEGNTARLNRNMITNVSSPGQDVVIDILTHPEQKDVLKQEVETRRKVVVEIRNRIVEEIPNVLGNVENGKGFFHVLPKGFFEALKKEHAYIPDSGRINFASITKNNVDNWIEKIQKIINHRR